MPKLKTATEEYDSCSADGYYKPLEEINTSKIQSLAENAETCMRAADIVSKAIDKKAKEWMSVYIQYYEALRMYTKAFLLLDKISISNHQCLFAYLCVKHSELNLDWNFFQKVRTKRNGINYYGQKVEYQDWKEIEVQIKIYISTIKESINRFLRI